MGIVKLPHDWHLLTPPEMNQIVKVTKHPSPGLRPQYLLNERGKPQLVEIAAHRSHLALTPELLAEVHAEDYPEITATPAQLVWLRPYQREDVEFITKRSGVILASDLGIGKTAIASAAAGEAYTTIVCPSSAIIVWEQECQRMGWSYAVLDHKRYRDTLRNGGYDRVKALIVSYNLLPALAGSMLTFSKRKTHTLIADEAHQLTKKKVTWSEMFRMIARERTILLTATPMRNRLRSLWGLLDCACPHAFGSEYDFRKYYCGAAQGAYGLEDGSPSNQLELAERLTECVIKRTRASVRLPLPNHTRRAVNCTVESQELVTALENIRMLSKRKQSAEALQALGVLRVVVGRAKAHEALAMLDDLVDEHGRVILWVWHHEVADILKTWKREGVPVDVLLGDTHTKARAKIVDEWRAGDASRPRVLIASVGAAATAIALTTAKMALFVELDWTPMNLIQAEKRHFRFGNVHKDIETAYMVSQVSIDKKMISALFEKVEVSEAVLGVDGSMAQIRDLLTEQPTSESIARRWLEREGATCTNF